MHVMTLGPFAHEEAERSFFVGEGGEDIETVERRGEGWRDVEGDVDEEQTWELI